MRITFVQLWIPSVAYWLTSANYLSTIRSKLNRECTDMQSVYVCKSYPRLYIYSNDTLEQLSSTGNWRVYNYTNAPLTNRPQGRKSMLASVSSFIDAHNTCFTDGALSDKCEIKISNFQLLQYFRTTIWRHISVLEDKTLNKVQVSYISTYISSIK